MSEEKIERKKPLNIMDYVRGWGEDLVDINKNILFSATERTFARQRAQVVWLGQKINNWVDILKENAGVLVKEAGICVGREYNQYYSSQVSDVNIVLSLSIPGYICSDKIENLAIKSLISGGIKKTLALDLLSRFPPPFSTVHPNFAANAEDVFKFSTTNGQLGWYGTEIDKINKYWGQVFAPSIDLVLKSFDAKLIECILPKHKHGGGICFKVIYKKEITVAERAQLEKSLLKTLSSNKIYCRNIN